MQPKAESKRGAFLSILPDILSISGLALMGYGLYLYAPWISFSVVGTILLLSGLKLGAGERQ